MLHIKKHIVRGYINSTATTLSLNKKISFPPFTTEKRNPFHRISLNDDCSQLQKWCVPERRNFFSDPYIETNEIIQQNSSLIKLNFCLYQRSFSAVVTGCAINILPQCGATNKEIDNSSANIFLHHRRRHIRVFL